MGYFSIYFLDILPVSLSLEIMNEITFTIVRSKRRTLALLVKPDGSVVARAPLFLPQKEIEKFVFEKREWIEKTQKRVHSRKTKKMSFSDGSEISLFGKKVLLKYTKNIRKIARDGDCLLVPESDSAIVKKKVEKFFRDSLSDIIKARVFSYSKKTGLKPVAVRISGAKRRWGSCTSRGVVSFSYMLAMVSVDLIDYVVAHELAHLKHHNHSPAFYSLLEEILPDHRERSKRLKKHAESFVL